MIATPRSSLSFTALGVPHSSGQATAARRDEKLIFAAEREIVAKVGERNTVGDMNMQWCIWPFVYDFLLLDLRLIRWQLQFRRPEEKQDTKTDTLLSQTLCDITEGVSRNACCHAHDLRNETSRKIGLFLRSSLTATDGPSRETHNKR